MIGVGVSGLNSSNVFCFFCALVTVPLEYFDLEILPVITVIVLFLTTDG